MATKTTYIASQAKRPLERKTASSDGVHRLKSTSTRLPAVTTGLIASSNNPPTTIQPSRSGGSTKPRLAPMINAAKASASQPAPK